MKERDEILYQDMPDGSREMYVNGACIGRLMPEVSQATLEASPGIQNWSHPRGKVSTKLFDPSSPERFAKQWSRNWSGSYPYDRSVAGNVVNITDGTEYIVPSAQAYAEKHGRSMEFVRR